MSDEVINRIENGVGRITLNRPAALHALNAPMCRAVHGALDAWARDPEVKLVLVDHAPGTRGFCAGGDIRMLAESGAGDGEDAFAFFAAEYRMNAAIKSFPKPYVALIDGVTMGGGVGISVHGSHRVSTERTVFAMPETGIGLFPDVGGGWFLPRLAGELGTWLALTGARLKGVDVVAAGVATHLVSSHAVDALASDIISIGGEADPVAALDEALTGRSEPQADASYACHVDAIDRCFAADAVEEIIANLSAEGGDWALAQIETLKTKSPRTLKVALRQLREGGRLRSFEDNMRMEYRIARRQVTSHDFLEGVRAVIIDKDQAPAWRPARIEEVGDDLIADVFAPLGADELTF